MARPRVCLFPEECSRLMLSAFLTTSVVDVTARRITPTLNGTISILRRSLFNTDFNISFGSTSPEMIHSFTSQVIFLRRTKIASSR